MENLILHLRRNEMSLIAPHQTEGVSWLLRRENERKGGLLCDDMGLGKTMQIVSLFVANPLPRTLIVLPPVLIPQWISTINKVLKNFHIKYYVKQYTSKTDNEIRQELVCKDTDKHFIIICSYNMLITRNKYATREECYPRLNFRWDRLILDEIHMIRNDKSKINRTISNTYSRIRWGLTGTPINNKLKDLKTLLSYVTHSDNEGVPVRKLIEDCVLRRVKEKVLKKKLPPCVIQNVCIPFQSQMEEDIYKVVSDNVLSSLGMTDVNDITSMSLEIFEQLIRMRQVAACPPIAMDSLSKKWFKKNPITEWHLQNTQRFPEYVSRGIGSDTGNMSKINFLVEDMKKDTHNMNKTIIFCHFKAELRMYKAILENMNYKTAIIDGSIDKKDRADILSGFMCSKYDIRDIISHKCHFHSNSEENLEITKKIHDNLSYDVVLIQIDCGGTGLNLQGANRIYITSPHYNPAIEMQAIARAHRIGQKRPVLVKRLVLGCENESDAIGLHYPLTIDGHIHSLQTKKIDTMIKYIDDSYNMKVETVIY